MKLSNASTRLIDGMPRLIQAGMGIHISSARLANITSRLGALGVVSGAGLRHVVVEQVRAGATEAIAAARTFPFARYVEELLAFAPGGSKHRSAVPVDHPEPRLGALAKRLTTICAYVEVAMAKKGHRGKVGINVMWKCALSVLPTIYGSMLAGVDALVCGAGVPMELPGIVASIRAGKDLSYTPLTGTDTHTHLSIAEDDPAPVLARMEPPKLLPIVSNFAFCKRILDTWAKRYDGARPFAFVLENHAAGGHNAPPRNKVAFTETDDLDSYFDKVLGLGVPVYVAGEFPGGGSRRDYLHWLERGAYGIQVGSRFALCSDSGMRPDLRDAVIEANRRGESEVVTDLRLSPTGYPFKRVTVPGTLSDPRVYAARPRACNRMHLARSVFQEQSDGTVKEAYICPAMPEKRFLSLGGNPADLEGRVCLCNALLSTAGFYSDVEPPIVTLGESGLQVKELLSARQVMEEILTPEYVAQAEKELTEPT
jgi:NAD(P)H-dependent flavin oxidoreductase YrpB (nitropropane dioxygenase family)